jgi:hypothetical protein
MENGDAARRVTAWALGTRICVSAKDERKPSKQRSPVEKFDAAGANEITTEPISVGRAQHWGDAPRASRGKVAMKVS